MEVTKIKVCPAQGVGLKRLPVRVGEIRAGFYYDDLIVSARERESKFIILEADVAYGRRGRRRRQRLQLFCGQTVKDIGPAFGAG